MFMRAVNMVVEFLDITLKCQGITIGFSACTTSSKGKDRALY